MTKTFHGLLALADLSSNSASQNETKTDSKAPEKANQPEVLHRPGVRPSFHYNIQIHLPPTKDIEVLNAIFKSMKEHLLEY